MSDFFPLFVVLTVIYDHCLFYLSFYDHFKECKMVMFEFYYCFLIAVILL